MDFQFSILSLLGIVLLYMPGYFFRKFYYSGQFTKQLGIGAAAERFILNIFWGFIVQLATFFVFVKFRVCEFDEVLGNLQAVYSNVSQDRPITLASIDLSGLTWYILVSLLLSVIGGMIGYAIVRIFKLDLLFPVFRYANKWHYIFGGESLAEYKNFLGKNYKVLFSELDVLVNSGDERPKLYNGTLLYHTLSPTTMDLDTIVLVNTKRWSDTSGGFKDVPGSFFVIPYEKIVNFNIHFQTIATGTPVRNFLTSVIDVGGILGILYIQFAIPYYYYSSIGLARVIFAEVFVGLSWLFFVTAYSVLISKTPVNNKSFVTAMAITVGIAMGFITKLIIFG